MEQFSIPITQGGYTNATEVQTQTAYCSISVRVDVHLTSYKQKKNVPKPTAQYKQKKIPRNPQHNMLQSSDKISNTWLGTSQDVGVLAKLPNVRINWNDCYSSALDWLDIKFNSATYVSIRLYRRVAGGTEQCTPSIPHRTPKIVNNVAPNIP